MIQLDYDMLTALVISIEIAPYVGTKYSLDHTEQVSDHDAVIE